MKRRLVVTLIALTVAILMHWQLNGPGPIPEPWHMSKWRWTLLPVLTGFSMVLPGALVGFVAGRNGLLLGALVGFLGYLAGSIYVTSPNSFAVLPGVMLASLGHAVIAAAGGGTGQLLRSNTSLERTRGR